MALKLKINEMLQSQNKSIYWLWHTSGLVSTMSYRNFQNMILQKTRSVQYDNLEKIIVALQCEIKDILERV